MRFNNKKLGFALTGSHCTLDMAMKAMQTLVKEGADVTTIISYSVDKMDTRFGKAEYWKSRIREITGKEPLRTIPEVEPIGPNNLFDCLIIAPCTGNTLAKLANGITDTPVLMAAKAHLRNLKPLVIAISTNDGLGINAKNIGIVSSIKHIYLVPFRQDDPIRKPNSLVARMEMIPETVLQACEGKQIQPVLADV